MTHPTESLHPYVAGDIDAATRADVERHLAVCAECTADVAILREMHARLSACPLDGPDASFGHRLRARVAAARDVSREGWRWAAAGAAAAVIVLVTAFAVLSPGTVLLPEAAPDATDAAPAQPVFMVIFQEDVRWRQTLEPAARRAFSSDFVEWFRDLERQGHVVTGGKRLRDEGGRIVLTGGEVVAPGTSGEILTGFVLLRAQGYDEAVAMVRRCPVVTTGQGRVIVREVR